MPSKRCDVKTKHSVLGPDCVLYSAGNTLFVWENRIRCEIISVKLVAQAKAQSFCYLNTSIILLQYGRLKCLVTKATVSFKPYLVAS